MNEEYRERLVDDLIHEDRAWQTVKGKSMSEQKAFLEKVHIKNYRSLRNVTLPLKSLTVLVGPNASGKSNTLNALHLFKGILSR